MDVMESLEIWWELNTPLVGNDVDIRIILNAGSPVKASSTAVASSN